MASCNNMRSALAIALVPLVALVAGCLADDPAPVAMEEPGPEPLPPLPAGITVPVPPDLNGSAQAAQMSLALEMADMDIANNMTRLLITANGSALVEILQDVAVPASYQTDSCGASAVTLIEGGEISKNSVATMWMRAQRDDNEARLGGQAVGTDDRYGDTSGGTQTYNFSATYRIKAGDQVLVEMGGRNTDYFHAATTNGVQDAHWSYLINTTGPVRVEVLESRAIQCGSGSYQAGGTLHAHGYLADFAVDTRVAINATSAGSIQFGAGIGADAKQVDVHFLGQTYTNPRFLAEARDEPGEIAIQFNAWGDAAGAARWLMVDAYWPNIGR